MIGIGVAVTRRPLPHHRAYGSVHGGSSGYANTPRQRRKPKRPKVGIGEPHREGWGPFTCAGARPSTAVVWRSRGPRYSNPDRESVAESADGATKFDKRRRQRQVRGFAEGYRRPEAHTDRKRVG